MGERLVTNVGMAGVLGCRRLSGYASPHKHVEVHPSSPLFILAHPPLSC